MVIILKPTRNKGGKLYIGFTLVVQNVLSQKYKYSSKLNPPPINYVCSHCHLNYSRLPIFNLDLYQTHPHIINKLETFSTCGFVSYSYPNIASLAFPRPVNAVRHFYCVLVRLPLLLNMHLFLMFLPL